ncbi:SIMPL domain-containing protein [Thermomonospora cellulosilytica]|uniref:Uncharacterized protein YggE n=1 Tax=Thermomonospora cellulosilytica TaxID=1411118 RepID=A0A7W3N537_9ACTN|nr:SIMPL domain-containing protein [Thermomonospora cellulosilytica]MBA9007638.1 uncharacterized protein YggE [Thermomonospora cellulosilytica]
MTQEPVISVRGEALLEVDPEIAHLSVYVQSKDDDRRKALDRLVANNRHCLELIRSYGDAVEKLETGALTVTPVLKYRRREGDINYYQGTVWIKVTVQDLSVLGELVTRLADTERTRVDGPYWALRRDSEVYAEAARQAVHQAVQRARSYAEALGSELTGLVELADEGLTSRAAETFRAEPMAAYAAAAPVAAAEEPPPLDLEPRTQTVSATVEARFTVSRPSFG